VYAVNHASNVEPPILFDVLQDLFPRLRILYKAELRKLPILVRAFDLAGFVPLERGNRDQSLPAIERAAAALREGHSFLIFPEGTRSRTGELLPFKKGGFIMALKGEAPIVPVAISGARDAMHKGSPVIRPVLVKVRLGRPIETAGFSVDDRLIGAVRDEVARLLVAATEDTDSASQRHSATAPQKNTEKHRKPENSDDGRRVGPDRQAEKTGATNSKPPS
jgi:1-acyl-sn-glycerol-3-phosphate acyltransferase